MFQSQKIKYFRGQTCYQLSNDTVEVIVTTEIGPRIIAYRFKGGENILGELGPETANETELGVWHPWGGHRLWHAPESNPRSYVPDDSPIEFEVLENGIRLTQPVEECTGIEKEMIVRLDPTGTRVSITHTLHNRGVWPIELAAWGLTIMNGGGTTIIPNEPFKPHSEALLPARPMVLWYYTDLTDPRWIFGKKYTRLKSDPNIEAPQKTGLANKQGWAGYLKHETLFIKRFPYIDGMTYPDLGCNFATYTAGNFMEVESMGPLVHLEPNQCVIHIENWFLFNGVKPGTTEESLDKAIAPLVGKTEM